MKVAPGTTGAPGTTLAAAAAATMEAAVATVLKRVMIRNLVLLIA